ncbi:hypothetical protein K9B46_25095, partial [Klebsiella aerogenes]|uniref:hypothetical protein n=1 Tax=Klebsiella aerogenes TaxID=548 RepID=UPI001CBC5208
TALFAAPVQILGVLALLTLWHDPATLAAIERSGGLAEAVSFPVLTVIPAVAIGAAGAILGVFGTRFRAT